MWGRVTERASLGVEGLSFSPTAPWNIGVTSVWVGSSDAAAWLSPRGSAEGALTLKMT